MMQHVFYLPWVGREYWQGIHGKKVLVLGESHYATEEDNLPSLTNDVIGYYLRYLAGEVEHEGWMNTYTKFANSCPIVGEAFWQSVVFYNFVQVPMSGSRRSPSGDDFAAGAVPFFEVLANYEPDVVIVWGKRLWEHLPDGGTWSDFEVLDENGGRFYYYHVNGKQIPAYQVTHPSAGYSEWEEYIAEAIRRC
ncbi:hypothetical protein FACS1894199_08880 [Bacteroidia bacterium]|nr:hypothetical protein FACS1894199_08880 [Bacteroidia bacterium]